MKHWKLITSLRVMLPAVCAGCLVWVPPADAAAPPASAPPASASESASASASAPGRIRIPNLAALESQAKDSVAISLDSSLLGIAANFMDDAQPEDRAIKDVIAGLQGVYVRSYKFDHAFEAPTRDLELLRKQLQTSCWQSIVSVRNAQEQSTVDIFICQLEKKARGLAIIAVEPRELTIVNVVGAIDLAKLHQLEGHFGIPKLPPPPASPAR